MIAAAPAQQRQLMEVQQLDLELAQARHQLASLPEAVEYDTAHRKWAGLRDRYIAALTKSDDATRQHSRAHDDVQLVQSRMQRNGERIAAGELTGRELAALEDEMNSLRRRIQVLQDALAAAAQAREQWAQRTSELAEQVRQAEQARTEITARRDVKASGLEHKSALLEQRRADLVQRLPAELVASYEHIRSTRDGVGIARLVGRTCLGCRIELTEGDLSGIRQTPLDQLPRCEECGRLVVREQVMSA